MASALLRLRPVPTLRSHWPVLSGCQPDRRATTHRLVRSISSLFHAASCRTAQPRLAVLPAQLKRPQAGDSLLRRLRGFDLDELALDATLLRAAEEISFFSRIVMIAACDRTTFVRSEHRLAHLALSEAVKMS